MAIVGSCCVSSLYLSHRALAPRLSPASPCCQLNCILLRSITRGRLGQATSFHRLTSAWKKKGAHGRCERELLHRWRSPRIACQVSCTTEGDRREEAEEAVAVTSNSCEFNLKLAGIGALAIILPAVLAADASAKVAGTSKKTLKASVLIKL